MFVWGVTEGSSKDWLPRKLGECRCQEFHPWEVPIWRVLKWFRGSRSSLSALGVQGQNVGRKVISEKQQLNPDDIFRC